MTRGQEGAAMVADLKRAAAFAEICERLGKLVPRLASDHQGEVVATVAAIGRTLASAGLDWHDLAQRIAKPTAFDATTSGAAPPRPAQEPERAAQPTPPPPKPAEPVKPRREPSLWPTWSTLSHFNKLAWMDAIMRDGGLTGTEAETFRALHDRYYRNQEWSRKGANRFNRHVRAMWERGWRPEKAA